MSTALDIEAASWIGTPFLAHGTIKGAGVDCVHLAAGIYQATGILKDFRPPAYDVAEGIHIENSKVLDYIRGRGWPEVAVQDIQPGDLLTFRMGRSVHHVGVVINSRQFIHARPDRGVRYGSITDPTWAKRLVHVFRPSN